MKAVLLAGGLGTRISEETHLRPKPMIEIGGMPILWHIMKIYSHHGINDFIICCGYKGYLIKEYFANYFLHMSDVTFDLANNSMKVHQLKSEPWKVTLVDTGEDTMTGGRLKRVERYIDDHEPFCLTYGDGVSDVNISELVKFHKQHGLEASVTATHPLDALVRWTSALTTKSARSRKTQGRRWNDQWRFFVLSPKVLSRIEGDSTIWEHAPLESLAREGQLAAYQHPGFWQPMDTLRDKTYLEELWSTGQAPWKVWA